MSETTFGTIPIDEIHSVFNLFDPYLRDSMDPGDLKIALMVLNFEVSSEEIIDLINECSVSAEGASSRPLTPVYETKENGDLLQRDPTRKDLNGQSSVITISRNMFTDLVHMLWVRRGGRSGTIQKVKKDFSLLNKEGTGFLSLQTLDDVDPLAIAEDDPIGHADEFRTQRFESLHNSPPDRDHLREQESNDRTWHALLLNYFGHLSVTEEDYVKAVAKRGF